MNSWVSEVIAEPRNMQKTVDESIIDGVMSGLIRQNDIAEERFVPKLISNQPGSTMGDAIREELKGSESFDISVAFVSENTLKSMYQAFVDHAKKSGKRNRIITSTKNYFNSPKAFKELMKLQRDANVEVLIWEHGDSGESGGDDCSRSTISSQRVSLHQTHGRGKSLLQSVCRQFEPHVLCVAESA